MKSPRTYSGFRRWVCQKIKSIPGTERVRSLLRRTDYEGSEQVLTELLGAWEEFWYLRARGGLYDDEIAQGKISEDEFFDEWFKYDGWQMIHDAILTECNGGGEMSAALEKALTN